MISKYSELQESRKTHIRLSLIFSSFSTGIACFDIFFWIFYSFAYISLTVRWVVIFNVCPCVSRENIYESNNVFTTSRSCYHENERSKGTKKNSLSSNFLRLTLLIFRLTKLEHTLATRRKFFDLIYDLSKVWDFLSYEKCKSARSLETE